MNIYIIHIIEEKQSYQCNRAAKEAERKRNLYYYFSMKKTFSLQISISNEILHIRGQRAVDLIDILEINVQS